MRKKLYNALNYFQGVYLNLASGNLRVLAYHTIEDPGKFEKQLLYLKQHFNIIDLDTLKSHLKTESKLPKKSLLITFDDGDISVLENGLPLFKKYMIPSILFVITNLINTKEPFWWDQIRYYLPGEEGEKKSWDVKKWPNKDRVDFLRNLIESSDKSELQKTQLSTLQLEQLQEAGMQIANHSHTHPMFNQCSAGELQEEIKTSSGILDKLGFQGNIFAYPNGNFDPASEKALKDGGIEIAFLFDHKINTKQINPLRISRIRVDSDISIKEFKVKISGLHSYIYHNFKGKF